MAAPIFDRRISNLNNLRQDDSILPCTVGLMFWSKLWPIFLFSGGAKQSKGHPIQQKGRQYIYVFFIWGGCDPGSQWSPGSSEAPVGGLQICQKCIGGRAPPRTLYWGS